MAYSDFTAKIEDWMNRTDFTQTNLDSFTEFAESKVYRKLRTLDMLDPVSVELVVTAGVSYVNLPSDFLEAELITIPDSAGRAYAMRHLTAQQMTQEYRGWASALPRAYHIAGKTIQLRPTPDGATKLTLSYYPKEALYSSTPTTEPTIYSAYPDLLLFASCLYASMYIEDDERRGKFAEHYVDTLNEIEASDQNSKYSGNTFAITPAQSVR